MSTRPTGHNGLHNNNSPNSSDTRNGPTCFRCREQGHMRLECRERVFCNNCKTYNHDTKNLLGNNQPRTSTMIHTPYNGTSPAAPADIVKGLTQIMTQVTNNNKRDDASKQMMKNIKIFNGSNKAECITWINQVEAAARFTKTPFCELICQSMAPTMLHVFS